MSIRKAKDAEMSICLQILESDELSMPSGKRKYTEDDNTPAVSSKHARNDAPENNNTSSGHCVMGVGSEAMLTAKVLVYSGPVHLEELNMEGVVLTLKNLSEQLLDITSWTLQSITSENVISEYTFESGSFLAGGGCVNVWADNPESETGVLHQPPLNILWRGQSKISTSVGSRVVLKDSTGDITLVVSLVPVEGDHSPASDVPVVVMETLSEKLRPLEQTSIAAFFADPPPNREVLTPNSCLLM